MATKYWLGTAAAVAQIDTATPANVNTDDEFKLLIDGDVMAEFKATADTVLNVTAGLSAAWQTAKASTAHPWMADITATDSTTHVTLTASTGGLPFVITSAIVDGLGGAAPTLTMATTTDCAGPHHWDTAENWGDGGVPVGASNVVLADNDVDILWGLDQSAVALTNFWIRQTFTGKVGLNHTRFTTSADGTSYDTSKEDYRDHDLDISWDNCEIGEPYSPGVAAGSGRLAIKNTKAGNSDTFVFNTASQSADANLPAVRFTFANAGADLYVSGAPGGIGISTHDPERPTTMGDLVLEGSSAATHVYVGDEVAIVNFRQNHGTCVLRATNGAVTDVDVQGGTLTIAGTAEVTGMRLHGGVVYANSHAAIPIVTAGLYGGTLDFTGCGLARTITNMNLWGTTGRVVLKYDGEVMTFTNTGYPNTRIVAIECSVG